MAESPPQRSGRLWGEEGSSRRVSPEFATEDIDDRPPGSLKELVETEWFDASKQRGTHIWMDQLGRVIELLRDPVFYDMVLNAFIDTVPARKLDVNDIFRLHDQYEDEEIVLRNLDELVGPKEWINEEARILNRNLRPEETFRVFIRYTDHLRTGPMRALSVEIAQMERRLSRQLQVYEWVQHMLGLRRDELHLWSNMSHVPGFSSLGDRVGEQQGGSLEFYQIVDLFDQHMADLFRSNQDYRRRRDSAEQRLGRELTRPETVDLFAPERAKYLRVLMEQSDFRASRGLDPLPHVVSRENVDAPFRHGIPDPLTPGRVAREFPSPEPRLDRRPAPSRTGKPTTTINRSLLFR